MKHLITLLALTLCFSSSSADAAYKVLFRDGSVAKIQRGSPTLPILKLERPGQFTRFLDQGEVIWFDSGKTFLEGRMLILESRAKGDTENAPRRKAIRTFEGEIEVMRQQLQQGGLSQQQIEYIKTEMLARQGAILKLKKDIQNTLARVVEEEKTIRINQQKGVKAIQALIDLALAPEEKVLVEGFDELRPAMLLLSIQGGAANAVKYKKAVCSTYAASHPSDPPAYSAMVYGFSESDMKAACEEMQHCSHYNVITKLGSIVEAPGVAYLRMLHLDSRTGERKFISFFEGNPPRTNPPNTVYCQAALYGEGIELEEIPTFELPQEIF